MDGLGITIILPTFPTSRFYRLNKYYPVIFSEHFLLVNNRNPYFAAIILQEKF